MPSTAWSSAASSKTMFADLPPSSSVRPTPRPRQRALDVLADVGRAGEGDLVDAGARRARRPRSPSPVTMLTTPARQLGLLADLGQQQRGQRRRLGRLEHRGVAARQRRRELPRRHQQREVPRHDLADDAARLERAPAERVGELVGPARVVEEVRGGQRDVDVARLADRLAAVERLDDRQLARALLDQAREAEEELAALERRERLPRPGSAARAAATARSTSLGPAKATSASGSSVAGLIVVDARPSPGAVNSPPMKRS